MPAPSTDGPLVGTSRPMLESMLDWHRMTLLNICAGLTAEQLAMHAIPPSNLSLLGLVRHMAKVERVWFRERLLGVALDPMYDPAKGKDADFEDLDPVLAEEALARLSEEGRLADAAASGKSLDATFMLRGEEMSLRFVYLHMIGEYARHNGHADLLRQCIDGTTGR